MLDGISRIRSRSKQVGLYPHPQSISQLLMSASEIRIGRGEYSVERSVSVFAKEHLSKLSRPT